MTSISASELTASIKREQQLIQQNQRQRNEKFQECLRKFTDHLQKQISMTELEMVNNEQRNATYSQAFETAYERMLVGAEQIIRKMKHTIFEKREFWRKIIEEHSEIKDMDVKAECYESYQDKERKYYQAVESQKVPRIPYKVIIGIREQNQDLMLEQQKNKELETHVAMTRKNSGEGWVQSSRIKPETVIHPIRQQDSVISDQVIDKFMKSNSKMPVIPRPPSAQGRPSSSSRSQRENTFLDQFTRK